MTRPRANGGERGISLLMSKPIDGQRMRMRELVDEIIADREALDGTPPIVSVEITFTRRRSFVEAWGASLNDDNMRGSFDTPIEALEQLRDAGRKALEERRRAIEARMREKEAGRG